MMTKLIQTAEKYKEHSDDNKTEIEILNKKQKLNYKFLHAVRLRESEINFVFCERVLYVGTAPEQKTESAKKDKDSMSLSFFYKCYYLFFSARASPCPTIRRKKFRV